MPKILFAAAIAALLSFPASAQTISSENLTSLVSSLKELSSRLQELSALLEEFASSDKVAGPVPPEEEKQQEKEQVASPGERGTAPAGGRQQELTCKEGTKAQEAAFRASSVKDAGLSEEEAKNLDLSCRDEGQDTSNKPTQVADNQQEGATSNSPSTTKEQEQAANGESQQEQTPSPTSEPAPTTGAVSGDDIKLGIPDADRWADIVAAAAAKEGHPYPKWLLATLEWESRGDPNAVSEDSPCGGSGLESHSIGLFQGTPACGEGTVEDFFDPKKNIEMAVNLLTHDYHHFKETFPGCSDLDYVKMAGAGAVQNWETVIGCDEYSDPRQREYVDVVEGFYNGNTNSGAGL